MLKHRRTHEAACLAELFTVMPPASTLGWLPTNPPSAAEPSEGDDDLCAYSA